MKESLIKAIADMEEEEAIKIARQMLYSGVDPWLVLEYSKEAMEVVGARYEKKEYFLPELIIAGDLLKEIGVMLKPMLKARATTSTNSTAPSATSFFDRDVRQRMS